MYKITKKYGAHGHESPVSSPVFKKLDDAIKHVHSLIESDAAMKIHVIYRIYDFDELLKEIDSTKLASPTAPTDQDQSGGRGAGSRITPFSTTARPKGAVLPWQNDDDKDDDK
jgi:hypothetical protein